MTITTKRWLAGLEAAVVTGACNSIGLIVANAAFDIFRDTASLWKAIATATLVSAAAYLKQSPVPVDATPTDPVDPATLKDLQDVVTPPTKKT